MSVDVNNLPNVKIKIEKCDSPIENFLKEDKLLSIVKLFVCKVCKKKFTTKNLLKSHVAQEHKKLTKKSKIYPCQYCTQSFWNITLLLKHKLMSHSDTKDYCCHDCNKVFTVKEELDLHMESHCLNIKEEPNLTNDSEMQTVLNVYACNFCQTTFTETNEYDKHIKTHLNPKKTKKIIKVEKLYVCELCHHKLKSHREYEIHLRKHKKLSITATKPEVLAKNQVDDKIQCEYCQSISNCMSKAIQHKHRCHPQMPNYFCRVCGKLFPLKISFDNHMNSEHSYDKSSKISLEFFGEYKCIVCKVDFLTQSALDKHFKTAHVAIQFANTGFIPSPSTKIVQGNTTELFSIYYCHLCGSDYVLKHNLKQHLLRDHTENERIIKPPEQIIRCVVCTARFYSLKAFETHQLNHSDTDLYVANEEERQRVVNRIDQDFDINRVPGLF